MIDVYGKELKDGDRIAFIDDYNRHGHALGKGVIDRSGSDGHGDFIWIHVESNKEISKPERNVDACTLPNGVDIGTTFTFMGASSGKFYKTPEGNPPFVIGGYKKVYITHKCVMLIEPDPIDLKDYDTLTAACRAFVDPDKDLVNFDRMSMFGAAVIRNLGSSWLRAWAKVVPSIRIKE